MSHLDPSLTEPTPAEQTAAAEQEPPGEGLLLMWEVHLGAERRPMLVLASGLCLGAVAWVYHETDDILVSSASLVFLFLTLEDFFLPIKYVIERHRTATGDDRDGWSLVIRRWTRQSSYPLRRFRHLIERERMAVLRTHPVPRGFSHYRDVRVLLPAGQEERQPIVQRLRQVIAAAGERALG